MSNLHNLVSKNRTFLAFLFYKFKKVRGLDYKTKKYCINLQKQKNSIYFNTI